MSNWKYVLAEDYSFKTGRHFENAVMFYDQNGAPRLNISSKGVITIFASYAWDGCSPKLRLFDWFFVGTPDGTLDLSTGKAKAYFASALHDALYQFMDDPDMPFTRKEMDRIFLQLLCESRFSLRYVYWGAVRAVGGIYHWFAKQFRRNKPRKDGKMKM